MDQDWDGAEADLRRAIALSPGYASAHHWLGTVLTFTRRRFEEGVRELEIASQLAPRSPAIRTDVGLAALNRGEIDVARRLLGALTEEEPGIWRAPYYLGIADFVAGDPEAGTANLCRAWRLGAFGARPADTSIDEAAAGGWRVPLETRLTGLATSSLQPGIQAVECALLSTLLERPSEAVRWLRSVSEHSSAAWVMAFFPVFEALRGEPGFAEFLVGAGLEDVVGVS